MNSNISVITVFAQGLISFWSPCVLPLIPIYMGYLSGGTIKTDSLGKQSINRKKTLLNTAFFVAGICTVFMLLGLGTTAFGRFFNNHREAMILIGGIIITIFGIIQIFLFGTSKGFRREKRFALDINKFTMSPITAFIMGFTFSFAWTPCIGPILASVLILAASMQVGGFLLILVYTLGFLLPFLALGLFTYQILDFMKKYQNVLRYTVRIGGILMLVIGIAMIAGQYSKIGSLLT